LFLPNFVMAGLDPAIHVFALVCLLNLRALAKKRGCPAREACLRAAHPRGPGGPGMTQMEGLSPQ
jgi:hypothetical protein